MTTADDYRALISRGPAASALESSAAKGNNVDRAVRGELLDRLRAEIAYIETKTGVAIDPDDVRELVAGADRGLDLLFGGGALTARDMSGLEAVVRSDGSRPSLYVEEDFVDLLAPSVGDYAATLSRHESAIREVCRAVGRVDDPSRNAPIGYQGTAWMIAEGLVATNFHVLREIAPGGVRKGGRFEGRLTTGVAVHFGHEVGEELPARRFPIRRVVSVGREGAAKYAHGHKSLLNFDGLDMAVLELEPVPGRPFPDPLSVARADDPVTRGRLTNKGREIYVVGFPGAKGCTPDDVFERVFGKVLTLKKLAPGEITQVGNVPKDPRGWVMTHDASTLGGSSGSAVVDLAGTRHAVLGLHFGGAMFRQNWAHMLERMTADLGGVLPSRD